MLFFWYAFRQKGERIIERGDCKGERGKRERETPTAAERAARERSPSPFKRGIVSRRAGMQKGRRARSASGVPLSMLVSVSHIGRRQVMRDRLNIPLSFASARFALVPDPARLDVPRRGYAQLRKHGAPHFHMGGRITSRRIDTRYQHGYPLHARPRTRRRRHAAAIPHKGRRAIIVYAERVLL